MSTKAQHRAKVGLPPLVFGPQWADMLRHAYVQPVLSKARQDYMNTEAQKAPIPKPPYSITQDSTLDSVVTPEVRQALVRAGRSLGKHESTQAALREQYPQDFDTTLQDAVSDAVVKGLGVIEVSKESGDVITRTLDACDLLLDKPKRKYVRKAKVAEVGHE
jgi:hypothetical protein